MRKNGWPVARNWILAICLAGALGACGQAKKPASPPKYPAQADADASAPPPLRKDDTVLDVAGPWDFAGLKGDPVCRLNFKSTPETTYWTLTKTSDCVRDFPILKTVEGWISRGDGDVALTDKNRHIVLLFRQQEDGFFASITRLEETYYLTNQDSADFAAPLPRAQVDGRWMLTALGGTVLCTIDVKATDDSGAAGDVTTTGPCPKPDVIKDIGTFKRANGQLALLTTTGREILSFKPGDSVTWEATDAPGDQIFMTRGP